MKKRTAILTAAALLLCGCGRSQPQFTNPNPTGSTYQVSLEHSWRCEPVELGVDYIAIHRLWRVHDKVIVCYNVTGDLKTGVFDPADGSFTPLSGNGIPRGAAETEEGFTLFWSVAHADENYNVTDVTHTLVSYDNALNVLSEEAVTEAFDVAEGWARDVQCWYTDDTGQHYVCDGSGTIHVFSPELAEVGTVSGVTSFSVFSGADGALYCEGRNGYALLYEIDPETLQTENIPLPQDSQTLVSGYGDYAVLCSNGEAMYGYRSGEMEELMNFENSDLSGNGVSPYVMLRDGSILGGTWDGRTSEFLHLKQRTPEEIDSLKLISVVAFQLDDPTELLLHRYNRQSQDVHFTVKEYFHSYLPSGANPDTYYNDAQDAFTEFQRDMIAGTVPDVFFVRNSTYESLSNKGLFEDWRPWMEQDADFHREDYYTSLLDAMQYRGKQERLCFTTMAGTLVMKEKFLPEGFERTPESILQFYENSPKGMTLFPEDMNRSMVFSLLGVHVLDRFIDRDKETCSFDSPEFIRILELSNTAPERMGSDQPRAYTDDQALLQYANLSGIGSYQQVQARYGGEALTFPGFPETSGNGGMWEPRDVFAVNCNSLYKEEIWDFIKFALREDNQVLAGQTTGWDIPVNRAAAKTVLEASAEKLAQEEGSITFDGEEVPLMPPTADTSEIILSFLDGIEAAGFWEPAIVIILDEESETYFAGDCTAEECAKKIQSRVSLYLAEQS